jgi:pimeloyl-ACP methyl ester carboxylesterase
LTTSTYAEGTLPKGVRSRMIHGINGLDVHILEAGYESPGRPLALLLHGFPDLAYGWRHLIPILADAGYHVVAPDQRGFGRTTGWVNGYEAQLEPFSLLNMTRDALGLISALGYRRTAMLVGHDLGSPVAAYCALDCPDSEVPMHFERERRGCAGRSARWTPEYRPLTWSSAGASGPYCAV